MLLSSPAVALGGFATAHGTLSVCITGGWECRDLPGEPGRLRGLREPAGPGSGRTGSPHACKSCSGGTRR